MSKETSLQLVDKAVEVLDLLARDKELTAAQLAELMNEPRTSIYRLLGSLREQDMVEPGSRRGYFRLGFHLVRLGNARVSQFDERQLALPVMQRLHDETGETVFLCVPRGREAVCIERIDGRRVQSLALRIGGALPLHAGAASRALLAYADREFWNSYVADVGEPLEAFTSSTPVTARKLFPLLEETRRTGIAISDGDVTLGIAAIGAPVFDYRGDLRAALSISGVRPSILGPGTKQVREALLAASREVSRSLGAELSGEALASKA